VSGASSGPAEFPIRPLARYVRSALLEAVHGRARVGLEAVLEARQAGFDAAEPCLDVLPAGRDEIDEERQVVYPLLPLGLCRPLQRLETPDRLVQQAANLREIASDGQYLFSQPVLNGSLDTCRERRRGLRGGICQRRELGARAGERLVERGGIGPLLDALPRTLDRVLVHAWQL
jgi:hypothetical protein